MHSSLADMNSPVRPIILCLLDYYLPGFKSGGPLRSISNLVDKLGDELDFRIITRDHDKCETESYPLVQVNAWNIFGKSQVFYVSPDRISFHSIALLIQETPHDALYLNSFFSPNFSIYPLIAGKLGLLSSDSIIIAPRGEFSKGALKIKSLKKYFFILISKYIGLHKCITWQASSGMEFNDIRLITGSIAKQIVIASDLATDTSATQLGNFIPLVCHHGESLRLVFISRICPTKNLDFLLQVLAKVSSSVLLDVFGPIEDPSYFDKCNKLIGLLPEHIKVSFCGEVNHSDVAATFGCYDVFAFPTRGENYGHVIIESLAAGTPVLVSDQTPWRGNEELSVQEISLLDSDAWAAAIDQWANLDVASLSQRRSAAVAYANFILTDENIVNDNRNLFLNAISRRSMACAE